MAIITKKKNLQERVLINGAFQFVGRRFSCAITTERVAVFVAYNSFRDTEVEIFDAATFELLGVAHWERGLEVSHG